jgi:hypothetical protein
VTRTQRRTVLAALLVLAAAALSVGITATVAPREFYDGFPFLRHWVDLLPPYNEHLTTDVGEFQLAFGLLFLWAARRPSPVLVIPLCLAWMVSQALHLTFHVLHLEHFGTLDAVAQTASLLLLTVLPVVPIVLCRSGRPGTDAPAPRRRGVSSPG